MFDKKYEGCIVRCCRESCGFTSEAQNFDPSRGVYHDMQCPECGTTNLDTSALVEVDENYGFGRHNTLRSHG